MHLVWRLFPSCSLKIRSPQGPYPPVPGNNGGITPEILGDFSSLCGSLWLTTILKKNRGIDESCGSCNAGVVQRRLLNDWVVWISACRVETVVRLCITQQKLHLFWYEKWSTNKTNWSCGVEFQGSVRNGGLMIDAGQLASDTRSVAFIANSLWHLCWIFETSLRPTVWAAALNWLKLKNHPKQVHTFHFKDVLGISNATFFWTN